MRKSYHILYINVPWHVMETFERVIREVEREKEIQFRVSKAYTLEQALSFVDDGSIDLVFLDVYIFPATDWEGLSRNTLVKKLHELPPRIGVIIFSSYTDHFHIRYMFKNLHPMGFVIKKEMCYKEMAIALYRLIDNTPYYSKTVVRYLTEQGANTYLLDEENHLLLYLLSRFYTMKMITKKMTLSLSALEKRKRRLKDLFGVEKSSELIKRAKEEGFI